MDTIEAVVEDQSRFIEANTKPVDLKHLEQECVIPVFAKDNEPTVSHPDFIETVYGKVSDLFPREQVEEPVIRVSHPVKGRIPEARNKPAKELLEHEKTLYWERMAFIINVPTIRTDVGGNALELSIGGVRAYNQENLYKGKAAEKFKLFIGFKNLVCLNLCIWSDGLTLDLKAMGVEQLGGKAYQLLSSFQPESFEQAMHRLTMDGLTDQQFAHLIGRLKMYQHLSATKKKDKPHFLMGDAQLSGVVRNYLTDVHHGAVDDYLSLWSLYNLFTNANKSSYIDTFLERGANSFDFTNSLALSIETGEDNWFLS